MKMLLKNKMTYIFFKELRSKSADLFKETRLYRHFKEDLNKKAAWGTAGVGGAQSGTGRRWGWGSDQFFFDSGGHLV